MNDEASERSNGVPPPAADGRGGGRYQIVDLEFVRELIAAVDDSGIDSLEISRGGTRIRIAKTPTSVASVSSGLHQAQFPAPVAGPATGPVAATEVAAPRPVETSPNLIEVTSPMVGTFYLAPAPEAPPYVEIGSRVVEGQTLCILEAMKLMNELESEVQGVVREICADNSEPVEYGQVLFRIEPLA
jgi:acetyl-CoA carboxylase biotin carboxyl carrier protein